MRQKYIEGPADNNLQKISFYNGSEGYVAFQKWIGYTQDSGKTFIRKYISYGNVDFNNHQPTLTFGFGIKGVHAFNKDTIVVYGDYGFVPSILYSVDQGNTFKLVFHSAYNNPPGSEEEIKDVIFPENNKTGYAVDSYRVLKTTNGGLNWTIIKAEAFSGMRFLSNSTGYLIADNKVLKTINTGTSWSSLNVPQGAISGLFFLSENKGWISVSDGDYKIYYTANGGSSWTLKSNPGFSTGFGSKVYFTNDSTGYTLGGFDVYKTMDSGRIWEKIPRTINYKYFDFGHNDLFFRSGNQFWAGGAHGLLEITTNGGGQTLPAAHFSTDVSSLNSDNTVKLKNLSKSSYSYKWIKNSAVIAETYNASYVSTRSSVDTIKLVVTKGNFSDTAIEIIDTRQQAPCWASFSFAVDTATAKFTSVYNSSGGKHYWSFGDGTFDSSTMNPVHEYRKTGDYTIKHIIKNTITGCSDSSVMVVQITSLGNCLKADITYTTDSFFTNVLTFGFVPKPGGDFRDLTVSDISWNFGDGTISDNDKHQFDSSKNYKITLKLTNYLTGCVSTIEKTVFVFMEKNCNADFRIPATDPMGFFYEGPTRFYVKPHNPNSSITNTWIFNYKDTVKAGNVEYIQKSFSKEGLNGEYFNTYNNSCFSQTAEFDVSLITIPVKHIITNNNSCKDEGSTTFMLPTRERVYIRTVPDPKFPNLVTFKAYTYYKYGSDSMPYSSVWQIDNEYGGQYSGSPSFNTLTRLFPDNGGHKIAVGSSSCPAGIREVYFINYAAQPLAPCAIYPPDFNFTIDPAQPSLAVFSIPSTVESTNNSLGWKRTFYFGTGDSTSLNNATYNFPGPGTFNVILKYTSPSGCTKEVIKQITITSTCNTNAKFTATQNIANPLSFSFKNLTTPDTTTISYKWFFGNGDSSLLKNPTYTYSDGGTYKVKLIASRSSTCSSTTDTTFTINYSCNLKARFTRTGATIAPALISFSNQSTPDSATNKYKWYLGNGDSSTAKNPSYTYLTAGTYYVRMIATKGNCSNTFRDTIVITAAPPCNINAKFTRSGPTTAPALISFTNQTTPDSLSYKWHFGNGDSSTSKSPEYKYLTAGTYYVRIVATKGNCSSTFRDTIVITAAPVACSITAKFTRSGSTTASALISFTNQTTPDSASYKWHFGNGDSSVVKSPSYTYQAAGTYYVRMVATKGNCTSTFRDTIVITAAPVACNIIAKFSRSGATTAPALILFTNQSTPDSLTYKWYFGNGDSSTVKSPSYTYPTAGTYYVKLVATKGNCTSTFRDTIVITAPPIACNIIAKFSRSGATTAPALISFTNQTTPDSLTYKWYFGNSDSSTSKSPEYKYLTAGTYYVRMMATKGNCNSTFRDTIVITAAPVACNITARFSRSGATTAPALISFTNQSTPDSLTYKWHFGNGDSTIVRNPSYTYLTAGTYYVRMIATKGNCTSTFKDTIVVIPPVSSCIVIPRFTYMADSMQTNKIIFTNKTESSGSAKYLWSFGDGSSDSSANPKHVYWQPGNYTVCLQAIVNNTCIKSYCSTVAVTLPSGRINVTPNPVQNVFNLFLNAERSSTYFIRFTDFFGNIVKEVKYTAAPGANNILFNVADLAAGYYIITADNKEEQIQIKFLKF